MLKRCLRAGWDAGMRTNTLPNGKAMSRQDINCDLDSAPSLVDSLHAHLDLVDRGTSEVGQRHENAVEVHVRDGGDNDDGIWNKVGGECTNLASRPQIFKSRCGPMRINSLAPSQCQSLRSSAA